MSTDRRPQLSLQELEQAEWPDPGAETTELVRRCHALRSVPVSQLENGDLRMLIGQGIGLRWLLPLAVERLLVNPLAEGSCYAGDLLQQVIRKAPPGFWRTESELRSRLLAEIEQLDPALVEERRAGDTVAEALAVLQQRNMVDGSKLWDDAGREWTTKRTQWSDFKTAAKFCHRRQRVALYDVTQRIEWLSPEEARPFWQRIKDHFEVPGATYAPPDADGQTYAAHVWRSGDERLLGIEIHC